jgi:acid phosphatase (class A)
LGTVAHAKASSDKDSLTLHWLDPQAFAPERILPAPPAIKSIEGDAEMAEILAFAKLAAADRKAQALADGEDETPHAFNGVTGRDLAALPATAHLLAEIDAEVAAVVDIAKSHFRRPRPYAVDPALVHCGNGSAMSRGADRSYPSGHSSFAWSTAWVLGDLMPDRRAAIFARAEEFGYSRQICAVHFTSDIEAGHVLGVLAAQALLADPRLASDIAAARAELAKS